MVCHRIRSTNCFGYVEGDFPEFGEFSVAELEAVKHPQLMLGIEREIHFSPIKLRDLGVKL